MKKPIVTLLLSCLFFYSFSQKWKTNLGLEGGMGGGGMTALLSTNNPLIVDNSALKKGFAYTGGVFLQIMRPNYGFEIKAVYSSYNAEAESFSTPESINLKYLSIPLLFKVRLTTKSGYTSASYTAESYSLFGNTLYHHPSEYSAGGNPVTRSVFLYAGAQYDMLQNANHTYGTSTKTTEDISGQLVKSGNSFVAGLEFTVNLMSLDLSYQKGLKSIDPNIPNYINAIFVRLKFRIV